MTGFTRRRWPVVGRDDEVESALALLGGGSRGLLIHGEGGVGKTTLATALIEEITAGGRAPQVIRLHTDAAVLSTPWKVFADVLDPVSQDSASLTRAVNQVRDRLGQAAPALLHLEDAHLLDDPSATVLAELVQSTSILLLATTRGEPGPPAPLVALWRAGTVDRLDLQPLAFPTVVNLLSRFLNAPVTQDTSRRMWEITGGNPLYLRELTLALVESGALRLTEGAWSWDGAGPTNQRMRDLLGHELRGLDAGARELVDLVALAGSVSVEQIADIFPDQALATVVTSGLLVLDQHERSGRTRARITHPIHAEVIRSLILPQRRRTLYDRLATPADEGMDLNELFHRVNWALQCGIEPRPDHVLAATRAAAEAQSTELTIQMATEALRRCGQDPLVRCEILILRAQAHRFDGSIERALCDLREAEARLSDAPAGSTRDWIEVRIAEITADLHQYHHDDLDRGLAALTGAMENLPVQSHSLRHRLRIGRLTRLGFAGRFNACIGEIEQLRGEVAGDHPAAVQLVPVLALGYAQQGRLDDALAVCRQALTAWREEFNAFAWVHGEIRSAWFMACLWRGDVDSAVDPPGSGRHPLGRYDEAVSQIGLGRYYAALGRWSQAITEYRGALSRFAVRDPSGFAPLAWVGLAQACAAIGADDDARAARERYLASATRTTRAVESDCRYSLVQVAIALGEDDAHLQARQLIAWSRQRGLHLGALRATHLALCSAPPEERHMLVAELEELAGHVDGPVPPTLVEHGRALVAGDREVAAFRVKELAELGVWVPVRASEVRLTPRQREIANLVVQGLSNREIAERLMVSVRTVDTHVGHIFARLSVRSRTDLSRALVRAT